MLVIPEALSAWFPSAREGEDWSAESTSLWERFSRSFTWRGKHFPAPTWRKRWRTVGWLRRLSSRILPTDRPGLSEDYGSWLTSVSSRLLPASRDHASRTAQPASGSTRTTSAGSGPPSPNGFATFDPGSSSWKTSRASLWEDSTPFSGPWPKRGILRAGTCIELPKREPLTSGRGSSWSEFYPTPSATSYGSSQNEGQVPHDRPSRGTPSLETWAKTWPTPRASQPGFKDDGRGGESLDVEARNWPTPDVHNASAPRYQMAGGRMYPGLALMARDWPTPMADSKGPSSKTGTNAQGGPQLGQVAAMWATPTARDYKGDRGKPMRHTKGGRSLRVDQEEFCHLFLQDLGTGEDGLPCSERDAGTSCQPSPPKRRLNPRFVAWLMGHLRPTELICYDYSETRSCLPRPH